MVSFIGKDNKIIAFLLRRKYTVGLLILVLALVGYFVFRPKNVELRTVEAQIGRVEQIVSATGRVEKTDRVNLGFNNLGRVSWISVKVGDRVKVGQTLAMLEIGELAAQRLSALAGVELAQAKLNQLNAGAREEDIKISETNYLNAKRVYEETAIKNSTETIRTALNAAISAMVNYTDIQYSYFSGNSIDSASLASKKGNILYSLFNQPNLERVGSWYFTSLKTGLVQKLGELDANPNIQSAASLLSETKGVLYQINEGLDNMYSKMSGAGATETDKSKISSTKTNILSQISAINNQEQAIVTAENNMNSAQAQLNLKSAPATEYDIKMAEAQLKQAQASLALIDAQMTKNIIRAPINGVVSTVDIKRGEIASTGKPAISILGDSSYEITVNIPEVDVAKIKVGNLAQVYLDAFGQDIIWDAQVTDIYPGEKIIEGVPTYETKLKFAANDDRIKPGLTANLDIINEVRDDVLQIPTRAIYQKDGKKFVKVVAQNDDDLSLLRFASLAVATENKKITVYEVPINTGLKGSNGKTQIISGLETGDQILVQ